MQNLMLISAGLAICGWFAARVFVAARPRSAFALMGPQIDRYASALALCLLLAFAGFYVMRQSAFEATPLELKQFLIPVVLPFAIGAIVAPIGGRGLAIALTLIALAATAAIFAGAGYLDPTAQSPAAVALRWVELMRAEESMARIWWMLLPLIAFMAWTVAVFIGCRESHAGVLLPGAYGPGAFSPGAMGAVATTYVAAPDPWLRPPSTAATDLVDEPPKALESV